MSPHRPPLLNKCGCESGEIIKKVPLIPAVHSYWCSLRTDPCLVPLKYCLLVTPAQGPGFTVSTFQVPGYKKCKHIPPFPLSKQSSKDAAERVAK